MNTASDLLGPRHHASACETLQKHGKPTKRCKRRTTKLATNDRGRRDLQRTQAACAGEKRNRAPQPTVRTRPRVKSTATTQRRTTAPLQQQQQQRQQRKLKVSTSVVNVNFHSLSLARLSSGYGSVDRHFARQSRQRIGPISHWNLHWQVLEVVEAHLGILRHRQGHR